MDAISQVNYAFLNSFKKIFKMNDMNQHPLITNWQNSPQEKKVWNMFLVKK